MIYDLVFGVDSILDDEIMIRDCLISEKVSLSTNFFPFHPLYPPQGGHVRFSKPMNQNKFLGYCPKKDLMR